MTQFYSQLSYSVGNEDWKTEHRALKIGPEDQLLCITASGDRPLNLLASDCKKVVAIDANPMQTALCQLKAACLSALDYKEYIGFLGLAECINRAELFKKIEKYLDKQGVHLWNHHAEKIEKGILYQGGLEKKLQVVSKVAHLLSKRVLEGLFTCTSIDEQREFVKNNWNSARWQSVFEIVLNPFVRRLIGDPGLYAYVNIPTSPPVYIYKRMEESLYRFPVKENILFSLLFKGRLYEEGFSPHLTEEGTNAIRKRVDRLTCITTNVIAYLENAEPNSFDCFSLSDIASYMSKEDFKRLCHGIFRVAKNNARFCIREFMSSHVFPEELAHCFHRDHALEKSLEAEDRCFVYRFQAGTIKKSH